jgi:preprotein translocase subunit SecG
MYILITVLIVIASVLLSLLVLVQNSKGGGLAAGFSSSNQIMGVRKTTDFLEKATWGLVIFVVVLSIASVGVDQSGESKDTSAIQQAIKNVTPQQSGAIAPEGFGGGVPENSATPMESPNN